ncbi:MAG TPA: NADH-ubiquinone oxidoreductase-F iron-sulfur binding region domain-containing protein [Mycobacteriales bacterium]|nr:NADH-ubiquinone oxidoreductase-F iron-sulfur binding region domain-containing protein [Mycobacteriales bacterium]
MTAITTDPAMPRLARSPLHAISVVAGKDPVGCRLLPPFGMAVPMSLREHEALHGRLPQVPGEAILRAVDASGLTGRGGAGFPSAQKMRAVLDRTGPRVVVGNAAEGEPASAKDKTLLRTAPHLVLDGLQLAARVVGATRVYLYMADEQHLNEVVRRAMRERLDAGIDDPPAALVPAPLGFVCGEESAVVSRVSGGPALPRPKPPRVFEAGVDGRPTFVSNVETMAHIALIARHGAQAFREVGHADQPGRMLFTVSGAIARAAVVEAPIGISLGDVVAAAGGTNEEVSAVLLGGYHGSWLRWPASRNLEMANPVLRPLGLAVGAGVVSLLPASVCGVQEAARVLSYLADESAGQCGPCVFGMPRMAKAFDLAAAGRSRRSARRITDLSGLLERRGGCSHPDGTLRFLRSATDVFGEELRLHGRGQCSATRATA